MARTSRSRPITSKHPRNYKPPNLEAYTTDRMRRAIELLDRLVEWRSSRDLSMSLELLVLRNWFLNPLVQLGEQIRVYGHFLAPKRPGRFDAPALNAECAGIRDPFSGAW